MNARLGISACALLLIAGCTTAIAGRPGGEGTHTVACPAAPSSRTTSVADTGSAPRKKFRFTVDKSTTQHPTFTFDLQISVDSTEVTVPTTDMPVALSVTSSCPQGFVYRAVYQRPHVDPSDPNSAAYQKQYNKIAGMTLVAAQDRLGNTVDSDLINIPSFNVGGSNPLNSISDFNQATVGFPDQAIGVGAKWSAHRIVSTGKARIALTANYRLLSWHGNTVTVASQVTETGKPYSQMIQGHKVTIESLTGSGHGTITANLDKALGTGSIDLQTVSKASADDGSSSTISLNTRMTLH